MRICGGLKLDSFNSKSLIVGVIIGLVIGVGVGYIVSPNKVDISGLEQQITSLNTLLSSKNNEINAYKIQISDKNAEIQALSYQLYEKDIILSELEIDLEEKTTMIDSLMLLTPSIQKGEWNTITEFRGDISRTTEPFNVPVKDWRILWSSSATTVHGWLSVSLLSPEHAEFVDYFGHVGTAEPTTHYVYGLNGTFYFKIDSPQCEYNIEVQIFIPE